ncbi:DUF1015 domain-containing protein [Apibacter muscae]|uniref:DUF1015 domain-containing protein n=1 Tax=Apibacter muscae TaxID=2509004 RepID=UPI0011AD69F7|nr:DUF1015 domain-containing protein [Apibacter muscae]TWP22537.1 DUF1015 domain-containing protein [Apibacter muscae]
MLIFKPFKGIHMKDTSLSNFPMYSPDKYTEEQIKAKLRNKNPSYIDIIKPTFFKGESPLENRFKKVRKRYEEYINENLLESDPSSIYIYEQTKRNGLTFRGVIGLVDVENFKNNDIKVSERANEQKQEIFSKFLDLTYLQTNPVILSYNSNSKLEVMIDLEIKSKPLINIEDELGITHKLWNVENRLKIAQFKETIENLPSLYLIDGCYRMAGAIAHSDKIKAKNKSKDLLFDNNHYIMSLIVSSQSIKISEYNYLIKSLNGLTKKDFFDKLETHFTINRKGNNPYYPSHKHHISMYYNGEFYGLYIKHEFRNIPEGLGCMDNYLFRKFIVESIFNIQTLKQEKKLITYLQGSGDIKGIMDLKAAVDNREYAVGFGFYPANFQDLQTVSDLGKKIPFKSAYIEPNLLLGLLMFDMK